MRAKGVFTPEEISEIQEIKEIKRNNNTSIKNRSTVQEYPEEELNS
ncbi:MAG: hypothetical protein ACK5H1_09195 [Tenacibaculum sp.]